MKRTEAALGLALILLGSLFLLDQMGLAAARGLWGGGMVLAGVALLAAGLQGRARFY